MDEIELLEARQMVLLDELQEVGRQDPERASAIIEELGDIEVALQRQYAPLETISDARLCQRYGAAL